MKNCKATFIFKIQWLLWLKKTVLWLLYMRFNLNHMALMHISMNLMYLTFRVIKTKGRKSFIHHTILFLLSSHWTELKLRADSKNTVKPALVTTSIKLQLNLL